MSEIDTGADIDIIWRDHDMTVRIPLAGEVSEEWARRYVRLAERKGIAARAENVPGRAWIVFTLPAGAGRDEALETLEATRDLVAKADGAEDASVEGERQIAAAVREWWAKQRS